MSYPSDFDALARSLAELVGRGPADWATDPVPAPHALATRDLVVARLRTMTAALTNAPVAQQDDFPARLVATDPGHAFHAALADLPPARHGRRPPSPELLNSPDGAADEPWHRAARACLFLESHTERLGSLPGTAAWAALRGLADLTSAVVTLDEDLAIHRGGPGLDVGRHGALRLAIHELTSRVPATTQPELTPDRPITRPIPVRGIRDIPQATLQLATMIEARGADVTAVEARAAARLLAEGVTVAARALTTSPTPEVAGPENELRAAAGAVQCLYSTPMATLSQPNPSIQYLAGAIIGRIRALDGVLDRLDADPVPRPGEHAAVAAAIRPWLVEAAAVGAAVDGALQSSHRQHRLLAPPEADTRADAAFRWLPAATPAGQHEPRALAASRAARESLVGFPRLAPPAEPAAASALRSAVESRERALAVPALASHPARRTGSRRATERAGSGIGRAPRPRPAAGSPGI